MPRPRAASRPDANDPSEISADKFAVMHNRTPLPNVTALARPEPGREAEDLMKRREFIALIGGAAVAWPVTVCAQQAAMPVIGFLRSTTAADSTPLVSAFRQGLKETGYVEGQNVTIEYRWGEGRQDRLPALVVDLISRKVAVVVGNHNAALAAKSATITVPVVVVTGADPVRDGLVASLNRPGGNVTGVSFLTIELGAKRLDLLRQLVPNAATIAMLVYPDTPDTEAERRQVQAAAQAIGQELIVLDLKTDRDIETAFATLVQRGAGALLVGTGAFTYSHRERIVTLAAQHAVPAIYSLREDVAAGGLMSYAASITDAYRQAGIYTGRILKGEKPSDLPVMEPTKFELIINLKTAKALGLTVPDKLLALADEVIE
jgi:putative tryptophan/tyrosine transport system substrate-binding protein